MLPAPPPVGAVEVAPDLLLGALSEPALNHASLLGYGVTHVLNCTPHAPDPGVGGSASSSSFASWRVPVADDVCAPLHEHLEGAAAFIDAALSGGGRVCAFCADGRSTAPAVLAFYLMRHQGLSLAAALDAIAAAKSDAQPNVGFWQRLVEAESWLAASPSGALLDRPSVSLQQYKWRFLERAAPSEPRDAVLQRLELGRAEVAELIRVRSEQWTSAS